MKNKTRFLLLIVILFALDLKGQDANHYYSTLKYLYLNNNTQSAGFGDINTVSSDGYFSSGLNYNPSLLNKNEKVLGMEVFVPVWTDTFSKLNAGIYYAKKPTITFAYNVDFVEYLDDFYKRFNRLAIYTKFGYKLFSHSFRSSIALKNNQFFGFGIKHIVHNILMGPELTRYNWILKINTLALDVGYYKKHTYTFSHRTSANLYLAASLVNFGPKVDSLLNMIGDKAFIPTSLNAGILGNFNILGAHNVALSVDLAYQLDKYLVPSTPKYGIENNKIVVKEGFNPDVPYFKGIIQSFYDAPEGFKGEMKEYIHKFGLEIRINNNQKYFAALRFGNVSGITYYSFDHYTTVGFRAGAYGFYIDFSSIPSKSILYSKLCVGIKLNLEGPKLIFNDEIFPE